MDMLNLGLLIVIVLFACAGAYRGFSGELATLAGALIAAAALWFGAPYLRDLVFYFAPNLPQNASVFYIGIAAVIIAFILFFFSSKLIKAIGKWVIPQPFDAILGFIVGGGKAFLLISIIAGVITASDDYINTIREKTEGSLVANAAAAFWKDRFAKTQASITPLSDAAITDKK